MRSASGQTPLPPSVKEWADLTLFSDDAIQKELDITTAFIDSINRLDSSIVNEEFIQDTLNIWKERYQRAQAELERRYLLS